MQADSLNINKPDSSVKQHIIDSNGHFISSQSNISTKVKTLKKTEGSVLIKTITDKNILQSDTVKTDSLPVKAIVEEQPQIKTFDLYPVLRELSDSAVVKREDVGLKNLFSTSISQYKDDLELIKRTGQEKGWVLGTILLIFAVLIYTQINFYKHLSSIVASLLNIQVAEKLLREKNVLVRRVFFLLNLVFLLSISLFIFHCIQFFKIQLPVHNNFLVFLCITGILFLFLVIRLALQNAVGIVFEAKIFFKEYIHNTYLINKNLGLYLTPLVISVFYLKQPFADIVFYICSGIVAISLLYRYIRAIQIILKQNVFLLYSILYLCTLEILPALVGIKFVLSLR